MSEIHLFNRLAHDDYEQIVFCQDRETGLRAIIAIHDSTLGPGTGGCRMYAYQSEAQALEDVLRLSKGMTYKASISGLKLGGAKAVIIGDSTKIKTPALLKRFGQFVERLNGVYITAKDVGINGEDLKVILGQTKHVLGIEGVANPAEILRPLLLGCIQWHEGLCEICFWKRLPQGQKNCGARPWICKPLTRKTFSRSKGAVVTGADANAQTVHAIEKEFGIKNSFS